MNKKGFTLVELLAVIIILSILVVLAGTSVGSVVKDSKEDLYQAQISSIKEAARAWYMDNTSYFLDYYDCAYITLKDLKNYGLIDSGIIDPKTEKKFSNNTKIKISLNNSKKYGNTKINYEVEPKKIDNCVYFNRTTCTLSNDSIKKGTEVGAKYECEVKPGAMYNFYVLSSNDDETVNLIMDRNINSDGTLVTKAISTSSPEDGVYNLVAWVSKIDYNDDTNWGSRNEDKGPITAMNFLYNATKDWTNIPNIVLNYTDAGKTDDFGYGTIKTENNITKITKRDGSLVTVLTNQEGYINLKARMPYTSETAYIDYLHGDDDANAGIVGRENGISGIYGYWTLATSGRHGEDVYACDVHFTGVTCKDAAQIDNGDSHGVRPVITLPTTELSENN